jgi:phosphoribosylformylglycinamidine synthase PurS subunit
MSKFLATILLSPRKSIRSPESKTVMDALRNLGFEGIQELVVSKEITFEIEESDAVTAQDRVEEIARKTGIYNSTMEDMRISVDPIP